MGFHRAFGNAQFAGDHFVGGAFGGKPNHFALALRQAGKRIRLRLSGRQLVDNGQQAAPDQPRGRR